MEKNEQTIKKNLKKIIKVFITYTIENDTRIYQLKHTPFKVERSLIKKAYQIYGNDPINAKKIVFDNYMGNGYGCNCKYVTEELIRRRTDLDLVWIVKNVNVHEEFPDKVRLVEYGSPEALAEYYTAAVWVCNYHLIKYWNKGLVKRAGQYYIQMWHGSFGIKKIEKNCDCLTSSQSWTYLAKKNSENTDFWISNSSFEDKVYRNAFWSVKNILKLGHPRNDIFFGNRQYSAYKKVREILSIDKEENILLYVPTFREKFNFPEYKLDVARIKETLEKKTNEQWKIVVRLHPRMRDSLEKIYDNAENMIKNADEYPDIQELLAASQIVITDYSSCIFDFLLTGRPGFLFVPDLESYDQERGFYYNLEETPFPIAHTNEELMDNIKNFDGEEYSRRVKNFLKGKGSVEDGNASVRVCDLIEHLLIEKEIENEY